MKKLKTLALMIALACALALTLTACGDNGIEFTLTAEQMSEYNVTACSKGVYVFTADNNIYEFTESSKLGDYMNALVTFGVLEYSGVYSVYGWYINNVNGVKAGFRQSWYIYTDDSQNSSSEWGTYKTDDITLGSANFGISDLPVIDGCTYALILSEY